MRIRIWVLLVCMLCNFDMRLEMEDVDFKAGTSGSISLQVEAL